MTRIKIYKHNGMKVVNSWEFYHSTGLMRVNYTRWITWNVLELGKLNRDYFYSPGHVHAPDSERIRLRYYLTIDFTIGLCLLAKRKEALELRQFLIKKNK